MATLIASVTLLTNRGPVRESHEDAVAVGPLIVTHSVDRPFTVCVSLASQFPCLVADGMGGHASGEVASRYVASELGTSLIGVNGPDGVIQEIKRVNAGLFQAMKANPTNSGMGTTVAGILLTPRGALAFNVGDSRAYVVNNGFLRQLTRDDTETGGEVLIGDVSPGERPGTLLQSLGGSRKWVDVEPNITDWPLEHHTRFLICSDGLTDVVHLSELEEAMAAPDAAAVAAMYELVVNRGGPDNVSVLIVTITDLEVDGGENDE